MKVPCESCGEREATVHFTEIVGNEKRVTNLCEECARQKSVLGQTTVSLADLLGALVAQEQSEEQKEFRKLKCPTCGMTYADFCAAGRFGCPQDYEVFRQPLTGLLSHIQDGTRHVGKVPPGAEESLARHNELLRLRRELDRAVLREDYRRAKTLRDRIAAFQRETPDA